VTAATSRRAIRATARRQRSRRGAAIAALSTVVVIGGLAAIIVTSPGWENVQATFFSWPDFKRAFPDVAKGFWLDVRMFCVIEVVVLALGLVVALVRTSRAPALFPLRMMGAV
jgi:polar amino acid transport system permease protein